MSVSSEYTRTYTSFSGCDIVPTFGDTVIGELQAITYHVQREEFDTLVLNYIKCSK